MRRRKRDIIIAAMAVLLLLVISRVAGSNWDGTKVAMQEADHCLSKLDTLPIADEPVLAEGVTDPVFAFMLGLLDQRLYGTITADHLALAVESAGRSSTIPYDFVREMRHAPRESGMGGWVRVDFNDPLKVPIPYSMFGYHPGSLTSTASITLEEWHVSHTLVPNPYRDDELPSTLEIDDVTLWALVDGEVVMDVDGWIDKLLGGKLDDARLVGLALFRYEGRRYAMTMGFSASGRGTSGALDLETDEIRMPAPTDLKAIGRDLRGRVIRHLAQRGIPAWVTTRPKG